MSARRWWRVGAKVLHDVGSIGFGGGLAACLVIDLIAQRAGPAEFMAARQAIAAIAQWLLVPSMVVVVLSGLQAMGATRGYMDAGWAWLKALLGLAVFQATLHLAGASREPADALAAAADPALREPLLRAERNTLWVLIGLSVVNVVLAVWRPRLTVAVR